MDTKTPLSKEHSLFAHRISETPWVVRGRAGSGKSIFLTELALSYLERGQKVLHVSNTNQQTIKKHYQQNPSHVSSRNRLLHSRIGEPFHPDEILSLVEEYRNLLSFTPELLIIEEAGFLNNPAWKKLTENNLCVYLATTSDDETSFPVTQLIEVGETVEIHTETSHGRVYIDMHDRRIYEKQIDSTTSMQTILYASGAAGSEELFGQEAEKWGLKEVHYRFSGHIQNRTRGSLLLDETELARGTVSLNYVSRKLKRSWNKTPQLKKVLQLIWHMVNSAQQVFVVGTIQEDNSVHGGTGWSVELAQRWNKPVWVFDQEKNTWFFWNGKQWIDQVPTITSTHFAGSGTRFLQPDGKKAIEDLFKRSFSSNNT